MMGDKIEAKKIAKKFGLPVIEGSDGGISDIIEAKNYVKKLVSNFNLKLLVEVVEKV